MSSVEPEKPSVNVDQVARRLAPLERLLSPYFMGIDRIPDTRPLLFVGNHTIYGVLDVPFMYLELYRRRGIYLRALGDHIHFKIPFWGQMLKRSGVVDGTRENCAALMRAGECILVFPGGAREVAKRKGERYKLIWKERLGFVRLAIRHGCTIVPCSSVGADDAYDILLDGDEVMASPLGRMLEKLGVRSDALLPVATGMGPTPIPRPERLYFHFGTAIPTDTLQGQESDDLVCRRIRDQVSAAVEAGIEELHAFRASDPKRKLLPRLQQALALARLDADPVKP